MTATTEFEVRAVLETACEAVGLTPTGTELLSTSGGATFRLPSAVIVRIARKKEQGSAAAREVRVAKWLEACGIPAVLAVGDIEQPVEIDGHPVTFWHELPPHRQGTWTDVATAVRRLHKLAPPTDFDLGVVPPFVRLADRIEAAHSLTNDERDWMRAHLRELSQTWTDLPAGPEWCVVHGDAWVENVVVAEDGSLILVDLERTSIGPPGYDLVHTAVKHSSIGWISSAEYAAFCEAYGADVTTWEDYELLRDIREFRMTCGAAQLAAKHPALKAQAKHRLACVRGEYGPRPWAGWVPVP